MSVVQPVNSTGAAEVARALPASSVDAVAASLPRVQSGQIANSTEALHAAEREALLDLLALEQAETRQLRATLANVERERDVMQRALERRVRERTAALTRTQEQLYASILEQRRGDLALRHAEELYRGFFENAVVGIYQSTPDGHFLTVNAALVRMYGYENAEQLLASVRDIASDLYVDRNNRDEFLRRMAESGAVNGLEYQVRRRDGRVIWISEHARAVRDRRQRIVRYEGVVRDITPRKNAEADKLALETQLQQAQKMEAIGTLAGGIAHDFNNLLGAIIAHSELAADDLPEESLARRNLDEVLGASARARELVQQILTFSRRDSPERQVVRLQPLVREVTKLLQAALPASITLRRKLSAKADRVTANPGQLHQVLMNLCTNAAHAMRERGGELTVSLTEHRAAADSVPPLPPGDYVVLTVEDTGHGMKPEILRRVFEPFFTTKPVGEGTGLGLSVVHGIVKGHGGDIVVRSTENVGTTFSVFLPCSADTASDPAKPARSDANSGGTERVLLVEDHDELRRATELNLRRRGFRVRSCSDSRKALVVFQRDPRAFDVLITDQSMPCLSGTELIRNVHAVRPDLPVLLCSGDTSGLDPTTMPPGVNEILSKPLGIEALCAAIQRAVLRPAVGATGLR